MLLAPNESPAVGRKSIQEIFQKEFDEADGSQGLIIETLDFQDRGSTGYATGTWKEGVDSGKWLDIVERQDNGSLLFSRVCWNAD